MTVRIGSQRQVFLHQGKNGWKSPKTGTCSGMGEGGSCLYNVFSSSHTRRWVLYFPLQCPLWGPSWPRQTDSRDSNRPSLAGLHLEGCRDRRCSVPAGQLLITTVFLITKTSHRAVVPNLCWHQGPVSWKTVFPWVMGWQEGRGGWFPDDASTLYLSCTLIFITVTSAVPQVISP